MTTVNLNFKVRQVFLPYINRSERWACVVAHRRAGKTVACIMDLIIKAIQHWEGVVQREQRAADMAAGLGSASGKIYVRMGRA